MKFGKILDDHLARYQAVRRESWTIKGSSMGGKAIRLHPDSGFEKVDSTLVRTAGSYKLSVDDMLAEDWEVVKES